ncbi:MAG: DUF1800 domain-containing protein [Gemmatimonadetes bacterium]|nr:DUF1800 domain-containing protein [Gemmatimonadota bacterium]
MDHALHALNRFGLGAGVGESRRMADPRGWLRAQLAGGSPLLPGGGLPDARRVGEALRALRGAAGDAARAEARRALLEIARAESRAALVARVTSTRPFVERLVAFWSNHLCVSAAGKLPIVPLAGAYERDVIRPHVLGRFEDMVLASARHPAMLLYLDNARSIGPGSAGARLASRRGAARGLNENYARELLELHTLGVGGGYTQADVQQLARILTGWTVAGVGGRRDAGPIGFAFVDALHEPGAKTLLGERYPERGVREGEDAIRALCRHPSAARFVATKLVRHFVADDPPAAAVERVAGVFRSSDGDLRAVGGALVELPHAWAPEHRKFRTPQEWLIAALRALGAGDVDDRVLPALRQLRHPLWAPPSPAGFGDRAAGWADPDSLLNRAELARTIARTVARAAEGRADRALDPRLLLETVHVPAGDPLPSLVGDPSIPAEERIALALAGPAFQWR